VTDSSDGTPLDLVTDAYAALGAKDLDAVVALCDPGVVVPQFYVDTPAMLDALGRFSRA
jgi:ketosteroid isomerase-like protein